jgi:transcriptional regulator with XRE-family HTH domain
MTIGYSQSLVDANKKADTKSLGVALGRVCIAHNISVIEVADYLGVSRMTIYNWFEGANVPYARYYEDIERYMQIIRNSRKNKK